MPLPLSLAQLAQQYEQAGLQMYGQEPDVSGMQEYARQRAQEGNAAGLNALAAQFAGQDFQPLQAQFLKQAAAAQEPLKVGNAGYITPKGQFVKDPTYQNDRRAEVLLRQGQSYRSLAESQATHDADRDNRLMMARIAADGRAAAGAGANDARMWRGEDALRGSYDAQTKDLRETMDATGKIGIILQPFTNRPLSEIPAVNQQSLVILLNKFLDPSSVVREGEFNRVVEAQGLIGRAKNFTDHIMAGKPLNAEMIQQIGDLANLYQRAAQAKMNSIGAQYEDLARRRGFDPRNVILNYGAPSGGSSNDPLGILGGH